MSSSYRHKGELHRGWGLAGPEEAAAPRPAQGAHACLLWGWDSTLAPEPHGLTGVPLSPLVSV